MAPQQDNTASRRRTYTILRTLVEEYIGTASPVPSEIIARLSPIKVSSATVRNKMAELEEEGYILRPHISSGGIPSSKGYRFYIGTLDEGLEPPQETKHWIVSRFQQVEQDAEAWIRMASTVLSELSRNVSIVTYPRTPAPRVRYVHLVLIEEFLALLILVLEEARLKKHLIPLEIPGDQDNLTTVANKLTDVYTGLTHREIMAKTVELTPFESVVTKGTLSALREDAERSAAEYILNGLRMLLSQPEFEGQGKALEVLEVLEEQTLVNRILAGAPGHGDVALVIGDENDEESLKPFSIVLCQYGAPDESSGAVAVVGPPRMEYANVIGGMRFLSNYMGDLMGPAR
jgi:heat-inducible transcriptional repressor